MRAVLLVLAALAVWAAGPARAGELQRFQRGTWQALREAHSGQPMVVHFWGLTCGPCLVELPDWGRLAQERPAAGIVTVAADPYPMPPAALSTALSKAGLSGADNWMFDSFSERLRFEVDPAWQGELPLTLLIQRDGSVQTNLGVLDPAQVRAWLDAQK